MANKERKSSALILAAMRTHPDLLKYIKHQTPEICMAAR